MNHSTASYEQLIKRFVKWAESCPDIRGAVIVGSRARADHPADEWADLDIALIVTDPERYLSTTDWLGNMGDPLLTFVEPTATGDEMERRVLFKGMLDVDFAIISESRIRQLLQDEISPKTAAQVADVFGRGARVLIDKDNVEGRLRAFISSIKISLRRPPTEEEFLAVINDFLYHAVFTAKHLRRGELWWSKMCCDCYMQRLLLQVTEWHARAKHGWSHDTWFRGRFLEEWADPRILEGLRNAFAHYDEQDVSRALLAVMDLFRWTAMETAEKLSYPYPREVDELITKWVRNCLSNRT